MKHLVLFLFVFNFYSSTFAQTGNQVVYLSKEDDALSLNSVAVATVFDNVNGVYAKPIEKFLRDLVSSDKNWALAEIKNAPTQDYSKIEPEVFEDSPTKVQAALKDCGCKALLTARISKGPNGLYARLTLFTGPEGLPLLQETFQDMTMFEVPKLKQAVADMYIKIKDKLPYRGLILSRRGNEVTIDLGFKNGIPASGDITIAQILKVHRHPKYKFMVSVEKEIIGQLRITKTEDYLTFASISFEKEAGVLRVGGKVLPQSFISYPQPILSSEGEIIALQQRKDQKVAFGEKPQAWLPAEPPQFGKIGLLGGIGSYAQSNALATGASADGNTSFAPQLSLTGEFWFSSNWILQASIKQSIFQINNGLSSSTPEKVDMSVTQYNLAVGYNFLLLDDFFGPKLQVLGGYDSLSYDAGSSSPTAYTKMKYSALNLTFVGSFDVSPKIPLQLGALFKFYIAPSLSEGSVKSGSASNKMNSFGFFGTYRMTQNYNLRGELNFDYMTSDFSGTGSRTPAATSTTHRHNVLAFGIEYMF